MPILELELGVNSGKILVYTEQIPRHLEPGDGPETREAGSGRRAWRGPLAERSETCQTVQEHLEGAKRMQNA